MRRYRPLRLTLVFGLEMLLADGFAVLPQCALARRPSLSPEKNLVPVIRRDAYIQTLGSCATLDHNSGGMSSTSTSLAATRLHDSDPVDSSTTTASDMAFLAQHFLKMLLQPSVVSLPSGVLLTLVMLPFLLSKTQVLWTLLLFGGLTQWGRRVAKGDQQSTKTTSDTKSSSTAVVDMVSLLIASVVASWLTPAPAHHHAIATAAHQSSGGSILPIIGIMGITVLFLSPKGPFFLSDKSIISEKTKEAVTEKQDDGLSWEEKLEMEVRQRQFKSWDKDLQKREPVLERSQMRTVIVPRDNPLEATRAGMSCRDCFVPPGPIGVVLHSTLQGPAVHSVRNGSPLHPHVAPGDSIIAVDGTDTHTWRAEDVMNMLMERRGLCRRITILSSSSSSPPPVEGVLQDALQPNETDARL